MYITSKEFIRDFSVILWNRFSASNPCSRVVSGLFWRYWDILGLFSKKRGDCSGVVVIREMKKSYIDWRLYVCHTRPSVRYSFLKFQRVPPRSYSRIPQCAPWFDISWFLWLLSVWFVISLISWSWSSEVYPQVLGWLRHFPTLMNTEVPVWIIPQMPMDLDAGHMILGFGWFIWMQDP